MEKNAQNGKTEKAGVKELLGLFALFFKIGLVTFGGGLAMLPILERELVEKRGWATKERMMDYFAIGQSTPGIIAVNVATFIGFERGGFLGALLATTGVVAPSIIIISIIAIFLAGFSDNVYVKKALTGVNIAVAALLAKAVWSFRSVILKSPVSVLLFAISFVLIVVFKINTALVVLGSIVLGIIFYVLKRKPKIEAGTKNDAD
ncbi:MAG: chromate transporter [Spirochaetaceae bacterium]|nr:chromate transporter [Spirochaetaceae bacterium]